MEDFRLFDEKPANGSSSLGFLEFPEKPSPPLPPCREILPSEVSSRVNYVVETVDFDGFSLLKGRVNTKEVLALSNLDLVPGKYEGGLKLWECSLDLVKTLQAEKQDGKLSLSGKQVLELGCGHGLPGIFACLEGARVVHFQDFNSEVLQCLTIPNVNVNIQKVQSSSQDVIESKNPTVETRFFAGDWSEVHSILPHACKGDSKVINDQGVGQADGYDVILMAETVYSVYTFPSLYELIKKCLRSSHGVVYMAAKKHYFGVGGGSRRFLSFLEKDGTFATQLVSEVADGSSNVREFQDSFGFKCRIRIRNCLKIPHGTRKFLLIPSVESYAVYYRHGVFPGSLVHRWDMLFHVIWEQLVSSAHHIFEGEVYCGYEIVSGFIFFLTLTVIVDWDRVTRRKLLAWPIEV